MPDIQEEQGWLTFAQNSDTVDYLKQAYLLNIIYLVFGISLFYFSFLKARIKGTLINMGE